LTSEIWFPAFVTWILKLYIVGYGGVRIYQLFKLFSVGMILGKVSAAGFWAVIDVFTGATGNVITNM
jgi:hypothetical protein